MREAHTQLATVIFQDDETEWVRKKWATIRDAQQRADREIRLWKRVNAEVKDYIARSGVTDPIQVGRIMGENLILKDSLNSSTWWRNEARAHMDDLNTFLKLKEWGLL